MAADPSLMTPRRTHRTTAPPTLQQVEAFGYQRFTNREQSRLDFGARLLDLAEDDSVPLLERVKFLAIFSELLDEFFQVRVAALEDQVAAGVRTRSVDGLRPGEQLKMIRTRVEELVDRQDAIFLDQIVPALAEAGVRLSDWSSLDDDDRVHLVDVFQRQIFPVLTPLAVDPGHPFPYISNLSLNLVVEVQDPSTGERRIARVKVPPVLPRFVVMPDGERFVPLEQVIAAHLDTLFPGMTIGEHYAFRVTRNADLALEEDEADDLLVAIEMELRRRRFGRAVRLEVGADMSDELVELLATELEVALDGVYRVARPARPGRPVGRLRPRPARPARGDLDADDAAPPGHGGPRADRALRHAARARRARAPPLRLLRHLGRGLHRPGGRGPRRARDQADAVPHRRRQPDRGVADPGRRERQAGGGHRRAEGPLRRGGQHRLGPGARRSRRPRGLRHRRTEDALQDRPGPASRRGRRAALLPRRHRELQLQDGPHLRGPRPADGRRRHRRRRGRAVQLPHRVLAPRRLPPDPGVAGHRAQADHGDDRGAGRRRTRRAASSSSSTA